MARHKAGPKSSRLDPANCTAPNPSEVEDFVMRRQSLELKEVRQSIFFSGSSQVDFKEGCFMLFHSFSISKLSNLCMLCFFCASTCIN